MSRLGFGFGFNKPDYFLTLPFRYGAVAHYDFTDSSKLIEGATSTDVEGWKDSTVNGYNPSQPTASAQPTFTQPNGPVVFDGSDFLEESTGSMDFATDLTIVCRFKLNSIGFYPRIFSTKSLFSDTNGFYLGFNFNTSTQLEVRGSGTTLWIPNIDSALTTSTIILRISGTTAELFQNGVFKGSGTIDTVINSPQSFTIGADADGTGRLAIEADYYHLSAYQRALTDSEIANLTAELNS